MFTDLEQARAEAFAAVAAMSSELIGGADHVAARHLERLASDRDELLAMLHYNLAVPVLELSTRTGISWPQLYDLIDRVRDEHRRRRGLFGCLSLPDTKPTDTVTDDLSAGYASEIDGEDFGG